MDGYCQDAGGGSDGEYTVKAHARILTLKDLSLKATVLQLLLALLFLVGEDSSYTVFTPIEAGASIS